jgi:hypothetical protein
MRRRLALVDRGLARKIKPWDQLKGKCKNPEADMIRIAMTAKRRRLAKAIRVNGWAILT